MIDHVKVGVSDLEKAKAFYTELFGPLGYRSTSRRMGWSYFADATALDFGVGARPILRAARSRVRGTRSRTRSAVPRRRACRGRRRQRRSGLRAQYDANYYAAYVLDPDGNNIEAECHECVTQAT